MSMSSDAPIGVFDSGIGGLSILKAIRMQLPHENLIYVADTAHLPYGNKTIDYIQQRSLAIAEFLLSRNVKAIVVACNTATAAAIHTLRNRFSLPIVGVEPAIKPAVALTTTGVIGVLATSGTLSSDKFSTLIDRFGHTTQIVVQPCPGLVEQVEKGELITDTTRDLLRSYLDRLIARDVDTIVLGCTHYPFLSPLIRSLVGKEIHIIDTGLAVSQELMRRLRVSQLFAKRNVAGVDEFVTSGNALEVAKQIGKLWGCDISVTEFADIESL